MPVLPLKQSIAFLLLFFIVHSLVAEPFPRGCEGVGYNYAQNCLHLNLNEKGSQAFYLIQNRSDSTIEMERNNTSNAFMSPPLHISIDPMNWSAFAADERLNFKCYKRVGEDNLPIDCGEVLDVCQYPRARFAISNMGNYWIASNKNQQSVIQEAIRKGIYLKW